jgi:non-heme chloroperoxidase
MATTHRITGGNELELSVYECGNPEGRSILFIHGFCQSLLAWKYQFNSALADEFRLVALDLRGHGMSAKPTDPMNYTDGQYWADDIAAIIRELKLDKPTLVAWSYGGYVMCDYLLRYGHGGVSALNFAAAGVLRGMDKAKGLAGPPIVDLLPGLMSTDLAENIATTRQFIINCTAQPPSDEDREQALAYNMMAPPYVREPMFSRPLDFEPLLSKIAVPTLVTHGADDEIINPAMSEMTHSWVTGAQMSIYEGVGHSPFRENPNRFNRELGAFVRSC